MPSGLFSKLNIAFSFGFTRAETVKQSQPIHLIALFHRTSSLGVLPCPTNQLLRYSSSESNPKIMAASSSMVVSGDHVVDAWVSSCGNVFGFAKPDSVSFSDSPKICRKGRVTMRTGEREIHGVKGCIVFDNQLRYTYSSPLFSKRLSQRCFSSSSDSEGNASEASTDGTLGVEHLSSLAILPEQRIPSQNILKLLSGACYLPHPAKEETGGDDAHFICVDEQVIGVADGVGGWADVGVNAGEYARELMNNSVRAIREATESDIDPSQVLEKAHAGTNAMGSSTACIVALKNKDLHAINLGDSGFIVVRDGCIIFESPVQQHGFNFTYQLERGDRADLPSSGQVFKIPVAPGDVIVAGSDGLFDNLYNKEIASLVGDAVKESLSPDAMAQKIAAVARVRALDQKCQSPFSAAAQQAGFTYYGGKLDDLTVVVSYVSTSADG